VTRSRDQDKGRESRESQRRVCKEARHATADNGRGDSSSMHSELGVNCYRNPKPERMTEHPPGLGFEQCLGPAKKENKVATSFQRISLDCDPNVIPSRVSGAIRAARRPDVADGSGVILTRRQTS
jgi:hypothetical protein